MALSDRGMVKSGPVEVDEGEDGQDDLEEDWEESERDLDSWGRLDLVTEELGLVDSAIKAEDSSQAKDSGGAASNEEAGVKLLMKKPA